MPVDNDELTEAVIGAAIEVHRRTGPGLLESAYEACLCPKLRLRGIPFDCQVPLPIEYKGIKLDCGYRLDVVVASELIIEIKAVERLAPVHSAQLITYLRLTGLPRGLLLNFNEMLLRDGVKRLFKEQQRKSDAQS
jgi:GxxExxY protein